MQQPKEIVEENMNHLAWDLTNSSEAVTAEMATTNAFEYDLSDHEILSAKYESDDIIKFEVDLDLVGEPHPEKPFCGSEISVRVSGTICKQEDGSWEIESYDVLSCSLKDF
jgi:hypothetical protein